ncbi:hypothetical protein PORY_001069 [Pneumocystis oryctolagi]|uniref:Uncharacterized protein n=1 Tax=Pneumocystis oryctolagi TaxID=42067 RepID=A0ACB7CEZ2_9ASCO|nr:hypothetical protein PORY_001069 [Pneumocystis oryctolagi]
MTQRHSSRDKKRGSSRRRDRSTSPYYDDRHRHSKNKSRHREKSRERRSRHRSRENDASGRSDRASRTHRRSNSSSSSDRRSKSPQTYRKSTHSLNSRDDSSFSKSLKSDTEAFKDSWEDDIDRQTSQMAAMLGFSGFKTTHQQKVEGNDVGAVYKVKPTKYRQYMNRRGGFNRPLDTDTPRR